MKKSSRMAVAHETVAIVKRGNYQVGDRQIVIAEQVQACLGSTRWYTPTELNSLRRRSLAQPLGVTSTRFEVVNETTLAGIARVIGEGAKTVVALNFASARNPGGGFLNGAHAQ